MGDEYVLRERFQGVLVLVHTESCILVNDPFQFDRLALHICIYIEALSTFSFRYIRWQRRDCWIYSSLDRSQRALLYLAREKELCSCENDFL